MKPRTEYQGLPKAEEVITRVVSIKLLTTLKERVGRKHIVFADIPKKKRLMMDDSDIGYMNGINETIEEVLTIIEELEINLTK